MSISSSANPWIAEVLAQQRQMQPDAAPAKRPLSWEQRLFARLRLNLWALLAVMGVFFVVAVCVRMALPGAGPAWLFEVRPLPQQAADMATVLAPLLAVSVAIERLLETTFDWYEQSVHSVTQVVTATGELNDWVAQELRAAYDAMRDVAAKYGQAPDEANLVLFDEAQKRLANAEARLLSWTSSPEYIAWKRAITVTAGLTVGLGLAVFSDLGMLNSIQVPVPRVLDMLATGLVIGAGPGPMHSLIGILESGKKALDNVGQLAHDKAVGEAVQAVQNSAKSAGSRSTS